MNLGPSGSVGRNSDHKTTEMVSQPFKTAERFVVSYNLIISILESLPLYWI
jgi:hypothetical protein